MSQLLANICKPSDGREIGLTQCIGPDDRIGIIGMIEK